MTQEKEFLGFLSKSGTDQPVQSQKKVRSFKFPDQKEEVSTFCVAKTKALTNSVVTPHKKTNNLHMQKQRRISASQ